MSWSRLPAPASGGDWEFVDLLLLAQDHGIEVVEIACDLAVEQNTLRLPAIINLINQLVEPVITSLSEPYTYLQLTYDPRPIASAMRRCARPRRPPHERPHPLPGSAFA
ncbi:hypothetical protein SAMN06265370_107164 [Puniceibacterium sediminis]|uniref:Uncharacterized protein n=1 Tax=Puniceibacterium sediminis TaxID=1608407 RepID=A0A238WVI9_9RHOB|nr:hypothetical protein SAMN06265370_107164 [Puniceibacterium sediminis]